ncbi:MAG TPA: membrane-bound lytic murein transglycosylase MltF [Gammaproteobacteria bacterium]|nr:membrane-bound lytic murein transglycosylase MltF [Gammaproteobacteria bacterium]
MNRVHGLKKTALVLFVLLLASCESEPPQTLVGGERTLLVLSRNSPTSYYLDRDQPAGLEYDLVQSFARARGYKVRIELVDTITEIIQRLQDGKADMAAAGLSLTESRTRQLLAGPAYQKVTQQLVCRRGGPRPKNIEQLVGVKIQVASNSSYVDRLNSLKTEYPQLDWQEIEGVSTEDLLWRVWMKKTDCTLSDSNITEINRRYFPELVVRFNINQPESLVWYFPARHKQLQEDVNSWMESYLHSDAFEQLIERYTGFLESYDYVDNRKYIRKVKKILPRYVKIFEATADKYNFDWRLLAAQAYQESHWRPGAKSPTGVRGMMMLTLPTARELGVKSRLDPAQSIDGGAKYLSRLYKRLPSEVSEPDRTWFALAAYNIGMGHVWDARKLARMQGLNPDLWKDIKTVFPLMTRKQYYLKLKYGYARGHEPVRYVQRIRNYYDILLMYKEDL